MTKSEPIEQPYPIVEVIWEAAFPLGSGWHKPADFDAPYWSRSVGYMVKEADGFIGLASEIDMNDSSNVYGGATVIPRRAIVSIRKL